MHDECKISVVIDWGSGYTETYVMDPNDVHLTTDYRSGVQELHLRGKFTSHLIELSDAG